MRVLLRVSAKAREMNPYEEIGSNEQRSHLRIAHWMTTRIKLLLEATIVEK